MRQLIQLHEYPIKNNLKLLLKDKTTKQNIVFATDSYAHLGPIYSAQEPVEESSILGLEACEILPRISKSEDQQSKRTRLKAEVFTPSWVCNKMNNNIDDMWFSNSCVFNIEGSNNAWHANEKFLEFPKGSSWKEYVDSRRLEITCGEAPFLVSRYDPSNGTLIYPLIQRIGFLDRKLRVISENTNTESEWIKWVIRAYQSVYGYEWQGDNLLIARINLLLTFTEYLQDKWKRNPTESEIKKIINIITWNIWQMNGLTGMIPHSSQEKTIRQISLFEQNERVEEEKKEMIPARIFDWRSNRSLEFQTLKEMAIVKKFFAIIGNPPYQESDGGHGVSAVPVYQKFVEAAKRIKPEYISMIMPSRWFAGGKGLDKFRAEMLSDKRLRSITDYENANECFPGVDIAGGICFFLWDREYTGPCKIKNVINGKETNDIRHLDEFDIFIRNSKSIPIIRKVLSFNETSMSDVVSSRKPFGLPTTERPKQSGDIKLHWQNGEGPFPSNLVATGKELINKWKVITSYVGYDHAGNPGKDGKRRVFNKIDILPPGTICNETYLVIGSFSTKKEAENLAGYMKTLLFRFLVSQFMFSHHITKKSYQFVPLQDFNEEWDDKKLYKKYTISSEEIELIESMIKPMDSNMTESKEID